MSAIKFPFILLIVLFCLGCGKKGTPTPTPTPPAPPSPPAPTKATTKAVLMLPAKDEVCANGAPYSSTQTKITFNWNASLYADSYSLIIKDLLTSENQTYVITATQYEVVLKKNTPYSWYVKTKSSLDANTTVESDVWKFYNAGDATSSYAPYPAEISSPKMGSIYNKTTQNVTLSWIGNDVDNNIEDYDVYFGTNANPPLISAKQTKISLLVTVTEATTYYWKIITRDKTGNTSDSGVYKFSVM
jgi:hypothetical protein